MLYPASTAQIPESTCKQEPYRLLVVDDDHFMRTAYRLALEKAGFGVTEASDGYTALSWLETHRFDAILLDARMPGLDGFSTCRQMRDFLGEDSTPIIIATGQEDDESIDAAFASGATDFAPKPLNWRILAQRLFSLIRASTANKHLVSRSFQISSLLRSSSEAILVLDRECVIRGAHQMERLPLVVAETLTEDRCFFECIPKSCVPSAMRAWQSALTEQQIHKFLLEFGAQKGSHTLEGRFIGGMESELLCLLQDHSEAFLTQRHMLQLTFRDPETGVSNAKHLLSELSLRLRNGKRLNRHTVLIRLAGSDLRLVEPRAGRQGIETLARMIVERIDTEVDTFVTASEVGELDEPPLIARISESDFVVVLSGLSSVGFATDFADILVRRLSNCYEISGFTCKLEWIAGVADSREGAASAEEFIGATACAIHSPNLENEGKRVRRYCQKLKQQIYRGLEIERLLHRDIADGALEMHYQPKFDLAGLSLVGVEALIRWNSDELGPIPPSQFIPMAEQTGLIVPLSHLVLDKVFDQMVEWREAGYPEVPISLNISGIHLNTRSIVDEFRAGMVQRNIDPHLVELEVTESIMVDKGSKALRNLNELRQMGVRVAIDDFGTGYSSFSYLRKLPIDCLKIDRSFIQSIHRDPTAQAIARAVITVGHDIGLHLVVEGVETADQLACLKELGCDSVQGFFTGRPTSSENFAPYFRGAQLAS
ncbi:EAL domain-containing protein [Marinobacter salinisoli]|uniref:EAL domain-containing protein n=1 Tax=Marinobacter salinisoli TaxID=2769486 RepID=A0ABX7MNW3_9GAMM|nr:EAL domain-containing response regulator [Marinobacter salinisoli]QSP93967.1 EAL domain-containing protein [Marinobacter salinisoli]